MFLEQVKKIVIETLQKEINDGNIPQESGQKSIEYIKGLKGNVAEKWSTRLEENKRKYDELEPEHKEELDRKFKGE